MIYTARIPARRQFSWEITTQLRRTDLVIIDELFARSEGSLCTWIYTNPEQAAITLSECVDRYHQVIRKVLDSVS